MWLRIVPLLLLACVAALAQAQQLPATLRETGFGAAGALAFSPQYPLWSDGADKQRRIALPSGTSIDGTRPDAWDFPRGTRLWKTFSHAGRPVETRFIERAANGQWLFATYVWRADGREADLAPQRGTVLALPEAPGGRYTVPSRGDCVACHGGAAAPVLGLSALQLSPQRDANAVHGRARAVDEVDLPMLVERGLLQGLPTWLLAQPPRITAASPLERAALGALHGNCANCHHAAGGQVPVRLNLMQRVADADASAAEVLRSLLDAHTRYSASDGATRAVAPGNPAASVLLQRMRARDGRTQMPPLGTEHVDGATLDLLTRWISEDLPRRQP
jgi:mono/diheme cytochrome c family protein